MFDQCTPLESREGEGATLKEIILKAALALLLAALLASSFTAEAHATESVVYLCISPSVYVASETSEVFELSVDIVNVESLRSVGFTMVYNTSLLDAVQVAHAPFFPPPPKSCFELENHESLGLIKVNISLAGSEPSLNGTGTLVTISFRVVEGSETCSGSPLNLQHTLLLDADLVPISHDSVGAVYFWQSMEPDPPVGGRLLDLYTQYSGKGPDNPGGKFLLAQEVYLISYVTYNDYPVQQKLVAFQVINPTNESVLFRSAITDEAGLANVSFRIPLVDSSVGIWRAISVVDIAEEVVWDTISFEVLSKLPVGGYTVSVKNPERPIPMPPLTLAVVTAAIVLTLFIHKHSSRSRKDLVWEALI
jgi:hypothetical protein